MDDLHVLYNTTKLELNKISNDLRILEQKKITAKEDYNNLKQKKNKYEEDLKLWEQKKHRYLYPLSDRNFYSKLEVLFDKFTDILYYYCNMRIIFVVIKLIGFDLQDESLLQLKYYELKIIGDAIQYGIFGYYFSKIPKIILKKFMFPFLNLLHTYFFSMIEGIVCIIRKKTNKIKKIEARIKKLEKTVELIEKEVVEQDNFFWKTVSQFNELKFQRDVCAARLRFIDKELNPTETTMHIKREHKPDIPPIQ